jgi:hypothetical protein
MMNNFKLTIIQNEIDRQQALGNPTSALHLVKNRLKGELDRERLSKGTGSAATEEKRTTGT